MMSGVVYLQAELGQAACRERLVLRLVPLHSANANQQVRVKGNLWEGRWSARSVLRVVQNDARSVTAAAGPHDQGEKRAYRVLVSRMVMEGLSRVLRNL